MVRRTNSIYNGLFRLGLDLGVIFVVLVVASSLKSASATVVRQEHLAQHQRSLQEDPAAWDFQPRRCSQSACRPWSSLFGTNAVYRERIIVDCSVCVTMDHSNFRLEDGIDIRGRLVVPNGTRLRMETTSIVVQGELDMSATGAVDGSPDVVITMIGENDDATFEVPNDPRQCQIGASGCVIGQKGIVVAGGSIDGKLHFAHFIFWRLSNLSQ